MIANSQVVRFALIVLVLPISVAHAQQKPLLAGDFPNKTIRIVTAEPGGGQDFAARLFAQGLAGPLG